MKTYHNTFLKRSRPRREQPSFEENNLPQDYQNVPEIVCDTEAESNSEDELLRYAIMLSLQQDEADPSSDCVSNKASEPTMCMDEVSMNQSRSTTDINFLPPTGSSITQPSMLLNLPLEIKEMICSFVFDGEDITVSLRRSTPQKFILDWGHHLSILLVCREIGLIAMRCLRRAEMTIDLRQYRRATTQTDSCTSTSLEDHLLRNRGLTSICTKLILSQGQYIPSYKLQNLIPTLIRVEHYDYLSCRKIIRQTLSYSGRIFEYAVPKMMKNTATSQLSIFQESLPPNIYADLIFVCDTLICIPEHDYGSTTPIENSMIKKRCAHTESWKSLLKRGARIPCKKCISENNEKHEQAPQYRTAKLRHSILFNESNPEGTWLSKDWVVAGLSGGPAFSLGDMLAIHCHEYCLELIERGETLGI